MFGNKSGYSFSNRSQRTTVFKSQSFNQNFEQQAKKTIHESMDPKKALLREARDSTVFPNSLPVIFGMDITGSMDYIPKHMITDGLPTLISLLHEKGITDAAVLFMGLGDSRNDKAPFQIGQFESDDAPMDLWLTRTWIEGGGGGNHGESYAWAWYYAATRCVTDAWEKRREKGFIFTMGDDNCHDILSREFREVLGITQKDMTKEELYKMASEKWHVYHLNMEDRQVDGNDWKDFMGENLIQVKDHTEIPAIIARIITSHTKAKPKQSVWEASESDEQGYSTPDEPIKITL